ILATISVVAYNGVQDRAHDASTDATVSTLKKALEFYYLENGQYPSLGTDGAGYAATNLTTHLVPNYIDKMPDLNGVYQYVRGPSSAYGLRLDYDRKTDCKTGVNI